MMELVLQYYDGERRTALIAIGVGVVYLVLATALWQMSIETSFPRGMARVFLIAAVFLLSAGGIYTRVVNSRMQTARKTYSNVAESQIRQSETARMSPLVKSGFIRGLLAWATAFVVGITMFMRATAPVRSGVGMALILVGALGLCLEALSMQGNRRYLHSIETRDLG